jgi:hypothetical protein
MFSREPGLDELSDELPLPLSGEPEVLTDCTTPWALVTVVVIVPSALVTEVVVVALELDAPPEPPAPPAPLLEPEPPVAGVEVMPERGDAAPLLKPLIAPTSLMATLLTGCVESPPRSLTKP